MSKTIVHQKIPMNQNGNILIDNSTVKKFAELTKAKLPEDIILIVSPFDTKKIDGDSVVITIDCKEYTYNELMDIIEKASRYDDLCK